MHCCWRWWPGQAAVGVRKVFTYVPADGEVDADLTNGTFTAQWTTYLKKSTVIFATR